MDIIGGSVCSCSTSVSCKSSLGISQMALEEGEAASSADISESNEIKVSLSHRLSFYRHVRGVKYYLQLEVLLSLLDLQPDSGQLEERESTIFVNFKPDFKCPWIKKLEETGIGNSCKVIDILIRVDVMRKMITGRRKVLSSGLVAVETYLGWTLMGKVLEEEPSEENFAMTVL
ncbi:hypothetical protein TNCV_1902031 [Trichonephila clavipes]|nr:hypothetical protein TNCV_1902031 [Trichonephila clavipes]